MAQLQFKGKQFVQNHHLSVKYRELEPKKDKSLTDKVSLHDNLIIHGDNLDSLKALLPIYAGKVKSIYIDPPYNTGSESWVYNDNVNNPMIQDWLGKIVDKDDLTKHDKWLCMMMPRLKLLRELLSDEGVIFVSIDDNELHRLRMLMDEIFQSENFVATFVWKTRQAAGKQVAGNNVSIEHEYVLCYRKTDANIFKGVARNRSQYTNPDKDSRGDWAKHPLDVGSTKEERPNCFYDLTDPTTGNIYHANPNRVWAFQRSSMDRLLAEGKIIFDPKGKTRPYLKKFWSELRSETKPISTWMAKGEDTDDEDSLHLQVGYNTEGTKILNEIFGSKKFDYPKPVSLIKELLRQTTDTNSIILDSFAGSGTTAHAVLELNKEDGGNRKFILAEMEDYADSITAERVRKVIKGVKGSKDEDTQEGLGGSFSYFELGKPIEIETILSGNNLPSYQELAKYVFYTATGEEFDEEKVNEKTGFIGETKDYHVYLFYKPDLTYLKNSALTLDQAEKLGKPNGKKRLVFAPTKYLDQDHLDQYKIEFAQLPFEIYK